MKGLITYPKELCRIPKPWFQTKKERLSKGEDSIRIDEDAKFVMLAEMKAGVLASMGGIGLEEQNEHRLQL